MNAAQSSLRLGFAGTPHFAIPALDALTRSRHVVLTVFTQPDRPAGRGQTLQPSAVKRRALDLGLPIRQPPSFKTPDAAASLRDLELDALVVVAYGLILPGAVLAIPRLGCFNIHASLLPRWRGAAPMQRALLAGDAASGVTIMRMDSGLDTGPMLAARAVPIADRETGGSLHDRLAQLGADLIVAAMDQIADGTGREQPQPAVGVTYAAKIDKAEARIDWRHGASDLLRRVRAFNPWPVADTMLNGVQLRIWDAEPVPEPVTLASAPPAAPGTVIAAGGAGVDVACGQGTLRLLRLQLAGRKPLAAREFLKAHPLAGMSFTSS